MVISYPDLSTFVDIRLIKYPTIIQYFLVYYYKDFKQHSINNCTGYFLYFLSFFFNFNVYTDDFNQSLRVFQINTDEYQICFKYKNNKLNSIFTNFILINSDQYSAIEYFSFLFSPENLIFNNRFIKKLSDKNLKEFNKKIINFINYFNENKKDDIYNYKLLRLSQCPNYSEVDGSSKSENKHIDIVTNINDVKSKMEEIENNNEYFEEDKGFENSDTIEDDFEMVEEKEMKENYNETYNIINEKNEFEKIIEEEEEVFLINKSFYKLSEDDDFEIIESDKIKMKGE